MTRLNSTASSRHTFLRDVLDVDCLRTTGESFSPPVSVVIEKVFQRRTELKKIMQPDSLNHDSHD